MEDAYGQNDSKLISSLDHRINFFKVSFIGRPGVVINKGPFAIDIWFGFPSVDSQEHYLHCAKSFPSPVGQHGLCVFKSEILEKFPLRVSQPIKGDIIPVHQITVIGRDLERECRICLIDRTRMVFVFERNHALPDRAGRGRLIPDTRCDGLIAVEIRRLGFRAKNLGASRKAQKEQV